MTDLVAHLVALIEEAPHYFAPQHDFDGKKAAWCAAQRAALSAAKDGGWVAVPVEPTTEMVEAAEDVEDLYKRGTPHTWITVYRAMLAARPLPNPPKEQNT